MAVPNPIAIGIISPPGSKATEILSHLIVKLESKGKRVLSINRYAELKENKSNYDVIVIYYHLNTWRDVDNLQEIFGSQLKLFTNVPIWSGQSSRELIDANWAAWCMMNIVREFGGNGVNDVIKAKQIVGECSRCIPKIITHFNVKAFVNPSIIELNQSIKLGHANYEDLSQAASIIENMNLTPEVIAELIINTL